jgi:hypothetical protein
MLFGLLTVKYVTWHKKCLSTVRGGGIRNDLNEYIFSDFPIPFLAIKRMNEHFESNDSTNECLVLPGGGGR